MSFAHHGFEPFLTLFLRVHFYAFLLCLFKFAWVRPTQERLDVLCVIQQRLSHRWVKPSERKKGQFSGAWHKAPVPNICPSFFFQEQPTGQSSWESSWLPSTHSATGNPMSLEIPPQHHLLAAGVFALETPSAVEEVIWAGPLFIHSFRRSASIYWVSPACQALF